MVFFNLYSIGALIAGSFMLIFGLFLLTLRNKSESTFHLGLAFLGMSPFLLAYMVASAFYHPDGAFHRYFTVFFVFFVYTHMVQFALRYPHNSHPRVSRFFLIFLYATTLLLTGIFVFQTFHAERIYHFSGQFWDFELPLWGQIISFGVLFYHILFLAVSFWKFFQIKSKERWTLLFLAIGLFITITVPLLSNILSKAGYMGHGTYMIIFAMFTVLGFFIVTVVYINNTRDKTSFIAKIIGVTLVTFLILFQWVAYVFLYERGDAFDRLYQTYTKRLIHGDQPPNNSYVVKIHASGAAKQNNQQKNSDFEGSFGFMTKRVDLNYRTYLASAYKSYAYKKLQQMEEPVQRRQVSRLFEGYGLPLAWYGKALTSELDQMGEEFTRSQLWKAIEKVNQQSELFYSDLIRIPSDKFQEKFQQFETKLSDKWAPPKAVVDRVAAYEDKPVKLKREILTQIQPMLPPQTRRYRRAPYPMQQHFISYQVVDTDSQVVYEAGYSYGLFRQHIHASAMILVVVLLIILALVLFIFPFFFQGSLVKPLNQLLEGLREINKGNLDTYITPKVQDEIGYLTSNFNSMARQIKESQQQLQDYADNLEKKVEERTAELKQSFEQIKGLKQQQDGDYFLTSLLVKPLGTNEVESDITEVDFLVKQKKQFRFRHWDMDIGGDLCIASTITLNNKSFSVFLNGDGMGKSVQGAGGALVLGVIFRAFLARTKMIANEQKRYPEQWLKDCFIELQKVFESFDGTMLISVVMGMVDDATGLMYYLNAEHPWTVLYRQGRASFIEQELLLRKIGTTGLEGSINIQTFQLEPEDVIIAGSDGRDDIVVGADQEGHRIINEDEAEFLRRVEEGHGQLAQIEENLLAQGDLSDDLSLLRLRYTGKGAAVPMREIMPNSNEFIEHFKRGHYYLVKCKGCDRAKESLEKAYRIDQNFPMLLRDLARLYLRRKEYDQAIEFSERYFQQRPDDLQFIYLASIAHKKNKSYDKAADLAERVRLRNPNMINNLINLADIYRLLGNIERSEMFIQKVEDSDPENNKIKALKQYLQQHRQYA